MRWCLGISMLCSLVWRSEEPCNVWGRRGPTARNVKMIWKFQPICFHAGAGRVLPRLIVPGMMITDPSLTPRVWQQGIWIEHQSMSGTVSVPALQGVKKCIAECRHLYCQEISPVRLFLPWRDQCDVLGITGLWDWVINKIISTVIRLSCGPQSFRPHRQTIEDRFE